MAQDGAGNSGPALPIPSLARQRLADQIADVLREQMLTGSLQPGDPIHERETAQALGVSRTPLREALLILVSEGMVEALPARSPVVANPSIEALRQLLDVISALEVLAGELACTHATADDLQALAAILDQMTALNEGPDVVAFFKADMAFHQRLVAAAGNAALTETHTQYNARLWRARFMSSSLRPSRAAVLDDHAAMLTHLRAREAKAVGKVMRRHLSNATRNLELIYQGQSEQNPTR